jgi:outer membrane immunogenic protein
MIADASAVRNTNNSTGTIQMMQRIDEKIGRWAGPLRIGVALACLAVLGFIALGIARADSPTKAGKVAAPIPVAAVAEVSQWTGCYVGGSVGYGWTRSEATSVFDGEQTLSKDNVLLSPTVGCDVQLGLGAVVGAMADVSWSDLSKAWESGSALDAEWQWFIGARAGVLLQPKTLVYGLVGFTSLDGGLSFDAIDKTSFGDLKGLTLGGGVEHVIGAGWSAKLEYRHIQLGSHTAPSGELDGLVDGTDVDSAAHQLRLGMLYRFGWVK